VLNLNWMALKLPCIVEFAMRCRRFFVALFCGEWMLARFKFETIRFWSCVHCFWSETPGLDQTLLRSRISLLIEKFKINWVKTKSLRFVLRGICGHCLQVRFFPLCLETYKDWFDCKRSLCWYRGFPESRPVFSPPTGAYFRWAFIWC